MTTMRYVFLIKRPNDGFAWGAVYEDYEAALAVEHRVSEIVRVNFEPRQKICTVCGGTGADPMSDVVNWLPCVSCKGAKYITAKPADLLGWKKPDATG